MKDEGGRIMDEGARHRRKLPKDVHRIAREDQERSERVMLEVTGRRAMKFGSHYLPTYIPTLDGPLPEFYRHMFAQMTVLDV